MTPKPQPGFTMADLLEELRAKMPEFAQGDVLTTAEMADRLGVSENTMRRRLKQLESAGLVKVVTKRVITLNGRSTIVTAWTVQSQPVGGIP